MRRIILMSLALASNVFAGVVSVNDSNFDNEVINSKKPVIVKTFTPWCGSCQDMAPEFKKASNEIDIKFVELNTLHNPSVRNRYNIKYVPTTLIFVNGKEVFRYTGVLNSNQIKSLINKHAN